MAGDLGKARAGQEEGTQMHYSRLQQKINIFTNNLPGKGETSYFPNEEKNPQNTALGESNTLSHKQHLGQLKLIFEISEIKRG